MQWLWKFNVVSVKQQQCLHRLSGACGRRPISRLRPRCLFRILIIQILLYRSETWTLLKKEIDKLEVFQMRCLRQILGVTRLNRLLNETVQRQCGDQSTIKEAIQKSYLQWFGHVCRMDRTQLPC